MAKRQIQQPLMSYRDSDGTWRHGLKGESVDIAADDLERFDKLNFGNNYTPKKQAERKQPAKKATTAKKRT